VVTKPKKLKKINGQKKPLETKISKEPELEFLPHPWAPTQNLDYFLAEWTNWRTLVEARSLGQRISVIYETVYILVKNFGNFSEETNLTFLEYCLAQPNGPRMQFLLLEFLILNNRPGTIKIGHRIDFSLIGLGVAYLTAIEIKILLSYLNSNLFLNEMEQLNEDEKKLILNFRERLLRAHVCYGQLELEKEDLIQLRKKTNHVGLFVMLNSLLSLRQKTTSRYESSMDLAWGYVGRRIPKSIGHGSTNVFLM
jgi:hypothetical protein